MSFLSELERLDAAATGAPFHVRGSDVCANIGDGFYTVCECFNFLTAGIVGAERDANAALIAFLRNHASDIAALVEAAGEHQCVFDETDHGGCDICTALARLNEGAK